MIQNDKFSENLLELEELLVRQFRALQDFNELTKTERTLLLNGDDAIMRLVEEKEAQLDKLILMEDNRRNIVQNMALALHLQSDATSIGELLPHLDQIHAERIGRLSEGIVTLARQSRELNQSSQALIYTRLDWLKAVQSFFIGIYQPDYNYCPPGGVPAVKGPTTARLGVEFRA